MTSTTTANVTSANVPAQRTEAKSVKVTSPAKTYFDGKSADEITTALKSQAKRVAGHVETFGAMIVEAYQRQVHIELGVTWEAYMTDVTGAFKPDTMARKVLVTMFRKVNMDYQSIARATKASAMTVKQDAKQAGMTSDARSAGQKSRTDAKSGTAASAKPSATVTVPAVKGTPAVKVTDAMVVKYLQGCDLKHVARVLTEALNQTQRNELAARIASPADDTVSDASRTAQDAATKTLVSVK